MCPKNYVLQFAFYTSHLSFLPLRFKLVQLRQQVTNDIEMTFLYRWNLSWRSAIFFDLVVFFSRHSFSDFISSSHCLQRSFCF